VDTGNLDSAIFIEDTGRSRLGRFTSDKDAIMHTLFIDTTQGNAYHGRGGYESYLEEDTGKMAARPFVAPAVERLKGVFPEFFSDVFRVGGVSPEYEE
jgi:hypothetical protein